MTNLEIVQQAQAALAKNSSDRQAQFVVDLFHASENLYAKTKTLQAEVDTVREELALANRENADYARKLDLCQSKAATPAGTAPFCASAFMQSMIATATAAAE